MTKNATAKPTNRRTRATAVATTPNAPAVPTANTLTFQDRIGMEFTYEETDATPLTRNRETLPNPHQSGVARAVEMQTTAPDRMLKTPALPNADLSRHMRWLREAGKDAGVTIRIVAEPVEGTETTRLGFRATKLIVKPNRRKKDETPTDVPADVPAA